MNPTGTTVKPNRQKENDNNLVFSYMTMRNLIGLSGMLLPLVLVLATHTCGCDNRIELFCFERHLLFAAIFFISLSIMSIYYFRKSDSVRIRTKNDKRTQKEKRNIIYKICGWTMIGCIVTLFFYFIIAPFKKIVGDFPIIFTLETVAVEAFAISWLTKGETLLPDGEHYITQFLKLSMQKFHIHKNNQIL